MAFSLPYGLHGKIKNTICELTRMGAYTINTKPSVRSHTYCLIEDFIPILRPLSGLTKEIEHKGETFVAIVELAKIAEGSDIKILDYEQKDSVYGVKYIDQIGDKCVFAYHKEASTFAINSLDYGFFDICIYQLQLFQQLLKWHFDLITEEYEKVYVTDEFNPYK